MDKHYGWQEGRGANAQGRQRDLDREDYIDQGEEYGGQSRGGFAPRNQGRSSQGHGRGFSGGHYGGFANEGFGGSANYGGNRGFSNQGQSGWGQSGQNYGQAYGQGRGFRGRGPKGYQRSDERLKELLSERLMDDDDIDASEITVDVKNGEVTLTGTVNSRQEKRAAEDIAEQLPGVRDVQNHLRVTQETSSTQWNRT